MKDQNPFNKSEVEANFKWDYVAVLKYLIPFMAVVYYIIGFYILKS